MDVFAAAQLYTDVEAGGPGSGRHPEAGSFKKFGHVNSLDPPHKRQATYYKAPSGRQVHVDTFGSRTVKVREFDKRGNGRRADKAFPSKVGAGKFLNERFGIRHNFNAK